MAIIDDILKARGYRTKAERESFLHPDYERDSHDPFLLPDMEKAVERLVLARQNQEHIMIYGDYDIDGLTASTLLVDAFACFGFENVEVFIPNRFVEGYGMTKGAVDKILETSATLILTVDCGSLSEAEIVYAKENGVDVIVTDHHNVAPVQPPAVAVVNPKRLLQDFPDEYSDFILKPVSKMRGKIYPFVDLPGVGVAFKLVQALQTKLEGLSKGQEKWLLDLVAFGTVCDVVTLRDENRMNVFWGLQVLQKTRRTGLLMLAAVTKIEPKSISARTLGFVFGPRLNASGRLETAQVALDLLLATDRKKALGFAEELHAMNAQRRAEQDRIFHEAKEQALEHEKDAVIIVSDPSWNHGIVGIVAAKLLEIYHKPAFVLQELPDGTAKGSARSFGDFSAVAAIRATDDLLLKGGGHKLAAGVTLVSENIPSWRKAVNGYYVEQKLEDQERRLRPKADVELEGFSGLDEALLNELSALEPYGNGNPEPVFVVRGAVVSGRRTMGSDGQHVAYTFTDASGQQFKAKSWNSADQFVAEIGEEIDVWFSLELNEWQGRRAVEGRLLDIQDA